MANNVGPQAVQWRGGPSEQSDIFVGLPREITINTSRWSILIHDGITPGGHEVGLIGATPDHRWVGTQLQFTTKDGSWGEVIDLGQELTQTQLDLIIAEGTSQFNLVQGEGNAQVARVIAEGDTQVGRLGTTVVGTVPYDIGGTWNGLLQDGMFLMAVPFPRTVTFPAGLTGSRIVAGTAPAADAVFSLRKDGVEFGTATITAGQTSATFTVAEEVVFTPGQVLSVMGPATADTTLANLGWAIVGTAQLTAIDGAYLDIGGVLNGKPEADTVLVGVPLPRAVSFPVNFGGSFFQAGTAATAETIFTISKNGSAVGSATFAAAGTVASFSVVAQTDFVAGDTLTLTAPATPDATLAGLAWMLTGER